MHVQDNILLGMCRICNDIVANSLITRVKALASPHLGLGLAKYNMLGWARARLEIIG